MNPGTARRICILIGLMLPMLGGCAHFFSFSPPPERKAYNTTSSRETAAGREAGAGEYKVRRGDTLYSIAFRNQVDFREVARINNINSSYTIYPGQVLRLSSGTPRSSTAASEAVSRPVVNGQAPARPPSAPLSPESATGAIVNLPTPSPVAPSPATAFAWQWPTDGVVVRAYAPDQGSKGLDFTGEVGQSVRAAAPGRVVYSGSALKGYGELIIIKHDDLHLSAYGYNRTRLVKEGDVVTAGQQIAELGIGPENKPVLHFEIRQRGKPVNPVTFLPPKAG